MAESMAPIPKTTDNAMGKNIPPTSSVMIQGRSEGNRLIIVFLDSLILQIDLRLVKEIKAILFMRG
jgi:hypothetical protein